MVNEAKYFRSHNVLFKIRIKNLGFRFAVLHEVHNVMKYSSVLAMNSLEFNRVFVVLNPALQSSKTAPN